MERHIIAIGDDEYVAMLEFQRRFRLSYGRTQEQLRTMRARQSAFARHGSQMCDDDRMRQIVKMRDEQGLLYKEIAYELGWGLERERYVGDRYRQAKRLMGMGLL